MELIVLPFQSWLSLWHRVDLVLPRVKMIYLLIEAQISSDKSSLRLNYWHEYKCVMSFERSYLCLCRSVWEHGHIWTINFLNKNINYHSLALNPAAFIVKETSVFLSLRETFIRNVLSYRFNCICVRVIWVCCKKTKKNIYSNLEDNRCLETPSSTHRVGELRS